MANSVVKLTIDSQEYDAKLKSAGKALNEYFDICKKGDRTFAQLDEGVLEAVQAMGKMETSCKSAKGSLAELQKAFTDMSLTYRRFTDEEKASPVGKAMAQSLSELKTRIQDTKKDLAAINQELSGSKFGQFGGVIDTIGHKMGLTANATELLTSKTALMYAGIGAGIAIVGKATDAWAKYNSELAKQDQITTVTTGLKGTEADQMTDTMRALSDTYKVDFREAINAANTLMSQFGVNGDEAIQLIKDGMQGMIQGDGPKLLQMIKQYAPAFRDAGVSASQLVAVIHNSEGGIFTDQNMNAIVMGMKNIRLMTKQTSDALAQLGIDGKKVSQDLNAGTITVFDALKQVAGELKNVDSNSQAAGEVMQAVFGRQGVTAGTNIAKAIETLNTNLEETKKQTGGLGDAFAELQTANEHLNTAIRDCFEYDGWEQMAAGIKSTLIDTLADVIDQLGTIKGLLAGLTPGQAKQERYGTTGTPDEVKRDLEALSKADADTREAMYQNMLQKYENRFAEVTNKMQSAQRYFDHYNNMGWVGEGFPVLNKGINMWNASTQVNTARSNVAAEQDVMSLFRKEAQKILNPEPAKTDNGGGSGSSSGEKSKQQQAQAKFEQAEKDYNQALEQAALEAKAGTADTVAAKKKELSAAESLWKSIGDAREIYDSDELKTAQEEAAKKVVELGGSVNALVEEQKKAQEAARELQTAQKKLSEAQRDMAAALDNNDYGAYRKALSQYNTQRQEVNRIQAENPSLSVDGGTIAYKIEVDETELNTIEKLLGGEDTIRINVEPGDVDMPDIPKLYTVTIEADTTESAKSVEAVVADWNAEKVSIPVQIDMPNGMTYTQNNLSAFLQQLKERIAQEDVGSTLYQNLTKQLADANALANLMQTAIKNGIDISQFNPQELWGKVFGKNPGDYITDAQLEEIRKKIEEIIGKPIKLDVNTGDVSTKSNETKDALKEATSKLSTVSSGLSSVSSGLSQMGVSLPSAVTDALNFVGGLISVINGVTSIIEVFSTTTATAQISSQTANTAALGALTAAVAANTGALVTNSAVSIIPGFAHGGIIPHAANGYFVPGTHYSGDVTPVMANAGELLLNTSSQQSLASDIINAQNLISSIYDLYNFEHSVLGSSRQADLAGQIGGNTQQVGGGQTYVSGEQIFLAVNNYLRRSGYGEIVTSRR